MPFVKSIFVLLIFIITGCSSVDSVQKEVNPYNPEPKMAELRNKTGANPTKMHFLVFGDSKGSPEFKSVLKRADTLKPQFNITTADLVKKGAGEKGIKDYALLDQQGGWFMRKYPMWPTVGNHEEMGGKDGFKNFSNFFSMEKDMYSFEYGNAKFIALPWAKVSEDAAKLLWLEDELKSANGKHIFIYKHRPHYTLGHKKYSDVEGRETKTTKLYDKYKVKAVFSGHDHIYYRTKRNGTNYIISAGAGAPIYSLKRESDAVDGDVYYGKRIKEKLKTADSKYKFRDADGKITNIEKEMFYIVSVKVDGDKVSMEMIDAKTGKVWDKADL